tara:strand:+ start:5221 stop:5382 length:162 start_codon:yes stop_codon:yes gene_type:complete
MSNDKIKKIYDFLQSEAIKNQGQYFSQKDLDEELEKIRIIKEKILKENEKGLL